MNKEETLQEYVCRILETKGLTESKVSQNAGGKISRSSISAIVTGKRTCTTISKLKALAQGLGVAEEEIFLRARGVEYTVSEEFSHSIFSRLCDKYMELCEDDKQAIRVLLEVVEHEIDMRRMREQSHSPMEAAIPSNGHHDWPLT